jgi:nucleotidyltransferase substrate binding protein (TIGR01987 family)
MSNVDYSKFKDALSRLEERYDYYETHFQNLENELIESVQESCIQRFEVCFDVFWKHLKKYLEEELGLTDVPASPKPLFKKAVAAGAIESAEQWLEFTDRRNDTSHDYSGTKAEKTFAIINYFIQEAITLYERMTGETWK